MHTEKESTNTIQVKFTREELESVLDLVQSQIHQTQALLRGLDRHEREGLPLEAKLGVLHKLEERFLRRLGVKLY